jgi:hypothetical protein
LRAFRQSPIHRGSPMLWCTCACYASKTTGIVVACSTNNPPTQLSQPDPHNQTLTTSTHQHAQLCGGLCYGCEDGCVTCAIFLPRHIFSSFDFQFLRHLCTLPEFFCTLRRKNHLKRFRLLHWHTLAVHPTYCVHYVHAKCVPV